MLPLHQGGWSTAVDGRVRRRAVHAGAPQCCCSAAEHGSGTAVGATGARGVSGSSTAESSRVPGGPGGLPWATTVPHAERFAHSYEGTSPTSATQPASQPPPGWSWWSILILETQCPHTSGAVHETRDDVQAGNPPLDSRTLTCRIAILSIARSCCSASARSPRSPAKSFVEPNPTALAVRISTQVDHADVSAGCRDARCRVTREGYVSGSHDGSVPITSLSHSWPCFLNSPAEPQPGLDHWDVC